MSYSFQLYSARNEGSLDQTLRTLRSLGYEEVEGWGGQFEDPDALAASLREAGLRMTTAHMSFAQLERTADALAIARKVGIETVFCPSPPGPEYRNGQGDWQRFAERLSPVAQAFADAGLGFGYHNHHWEFADLGGGETPMDLILGAAPDLQWEMDLAWLVRAGEDPLHWMDRHGSRISAFHVKDMAAAGENADEDGWADVGHGVLGWDRLIEEAHRRTVAKYFVMEHDRPSDPFRFARRSIETARRWS